MQTAHWAQLLQDSGFAAAIRGGIYIYPAVNVLHVLGVGLIVGSILALDFRIIGITTAGSFDEAQRLLTPFSVIGLLIAIPSGFALYASDAVSLSQSKLMWAKLLLIFLGIANAFVFRWFWTSRLPDWKGDAPQFAKVQAVFSIGIWIAVPVLGRLIAYV